ncbi:MAG TPA: cation:proton antiporter, partial [Candidatus Limnocylindrales bacterium]|nr:cation:proton antiporter [Candidatus Limnocylindrales bacterium]
MEHTAGPILEIGVLLLGAVVAGWLARRLGLPAILGYLALGIVVSPFTPGYVADRDQLQLLADLGVVLLLFEVGIEVDILRIRSEQRRLVLAAPLQVVITTAASAAALAIAGLQPVPAALIGLSIALSSSVVIVNITRSRRRTTDRSTEDALLGWSALQDTTGVAIAAVLLALLGVGGRPLDQAALGIVAFIALAVAVARLLP